MNEHQLIERLRTMEGDTPAITVDVGHVLRSGRRRRAARAVGLAAGAGTLSVAAVVAAVMAWPVVLGPSPVPLGNPTVSESPLPSPDPSGPAEPEPGESASTGPYSTAPTQIPEEALLPESAWENVGGPRLVSPRVVDWRLPQSCAAGAPSGATAMRTVTQGDGDYEAAVGVQQVAVFADADAAVAEAGRIGAALTACADATTAEPTTYVLEPLAVGAQGVGFATDYYGISASGDLDEALGTYLATIRRGNAVTVVALEGGESTIGVARETVTSRAQAAWELLCRYDSAGC